MLADRVTDMFQYRYLYLGPNHLLGFYIFVLFWIMYPTKYLVRMENRKGLQYQHLGTPCNIYNKMWDGIKEKKDKTFFGLLIMLQVSLID